MVRLPPFITYVTDPDLDYAAQQRIVGEVAAAALDGFPVRIAFRLPTWLADDVLRMLGWYQEEMAVIARRDKSAAFVRLAPLVQWRPDLPPLDRYWTLWFPYRYMRQFPDDTAASCSVHSMEQARTARQLGAKELIVGHIFDTMSHPGEPPIGVESLQEIAQAGPGFLTAIGGINPGTIGEIGRAGIVSVAVIRAISAAPDVPQALSDLREQFLRAY